MSQYWEQRRLLTVVCLAAAMTVMGCDGGQTSVNNAANQAPEQNQQTPENNQKNNQENNQESNQEDNQVNQSTNSQEEDACDVSGFEVLDEVVIKENTWGWDLIVDGDEQILSLFLPNDGEALSGSIIEFDDSPLDDRADSVLLGDDCTLAGCETLFIPTGGTLEVTEWDPEDEGIFQANFVDLELVEIALVDEQYEVVEFGLTWCIDDLVVAGSTEPMPTFPEELGCERQSFEADEGNLAATAISDNALLVEALSSADEPHDVMSLQLYDGPIAEGIHQLDDFNYATCENCLLIYAGCEEGFCEKIFAAGEGHLEIASAGQDSGGYADGGQFSATLSDAKLVEVTIDSATYETRIVEGGESWCVDQFGWNLQIQ